MQKRNFSLLRQRTPTAKPFGIFLSLTYPSISMCQVEVKIFRHLCVISNDTEVANYGNKSALVGG